jgi:hypothetical protein
LDQRICRTAYTFSTPIQHVRVDHGRSDVCVTQQLLHRTDVVAVFQQMGGKRMTERMATGRFGDPSFPDGFFDRPL